MGITWECHGLRFAKRGSGTLWKLIGGYVGMAGTTTLDLVCDAFEATSIAAYGPLSLEGLAKRFVVVFVCVCVCVLLRARVRVLVLV